MADTKKTSMNYLWVIYGITLLLEILAIYMLLNVGQLAGTLEEEEMIKFEPDIISRIMNVVLKPEFILLFNPLKLIHCCTNSVTYYTPQNRSYYYQQQELSPDKLPQHYGFYIDNDISYLSVELIVFESNDNDDGLFIFEVSPELVIFETNDNDDGLFIFEVLPGGDNDKFGEGENIDIFPTEVNIKVQQYLDGVNTNGNGNPITSLVDLLSNFTEDPRNPLLYQGRDPAELLEQSNIRHGTVKLINLRDAFLLGGLVFGILNGMGCKNENVMTDDLDLLPSYFVGGLLPTISSLDKLRDVVVLESNNNKLFVIEALCVIESSIGNDNNDGDELFVIESSPIPAHTHHYQKIKRRNDKKENINMDKKTSIGKEGNDFIALGIVNFVIEADIETLGIDIVLFQENNNEHGIDKLKIVIRRKTFQFLRETFWFLMETFWILCICLIISINCVVNGSEYIPTHRQQQELARVVLDLDEIMYHPLFILKNELVIENKLLIKNNNNEETKELELKPMQFMLLTTANAEGKGCDENRIGIEENEHMKNEYGPLIDLFTIKLVGPIKYDEKIANDFKNINSFENYFITRLLGLSRAIIMDAKDKDNEIKPRTITPLTTIRTISFKICNDRDNVILFGDKIIIGNQQFIDTHIELGLPGKVHPYGKGCDAEITVGIELLANKIEGKEMNYFGIILVLLKLIICVLLLFKIEALIVGNDDKCGKELFIFEATPQDGLIMLVKILEQSQQEPKKEIDIKPIYGKDKEESGKDLLIDYKLREKINYNYGSKMYCLNGLDLLLNTPLFSMKRKDVIFRIIISILVIIIIQKLIRKLLIKIGNEFKDKSPTSLIKLLYENSIDLIFQRSINELVCDEYANNSGLLNYYSWIDPCTQINCVAYYVHLSFGYCIAFLLYDIPEQPSLFKDKPQQLWDVSDEMLTELIRKLKELIQSFSKINLIIMALVLIFSTFLIIENDFKNNSQQNLNYPCNYSNATTEPQPIQQIGLDLKLHDVPDELRVVH